MPNVTSKEFQFQLRGDKFLQWTWQKTQAFGLQVKSKAEADSIVSLLKKAQAGELKQKGPAEDLNSLRDAKDYQVVPKTI